MKADLTQLRTSLQGKLVWREFSFLRETINEEERTVEIAFSSEAAIVPRWYGGEILSHDVSAIRLERFRSDAPLLDNHDTRRQIGIILGDTVQIGADKVLRARAKFDCNGEGRDYFDKVKDGTRKKASIGYLVHNLTLKERNGDEETYLVTDWEPYEGSMVSIPADFNVGVGRGADVPTTPDLTSHAQVPPVTSVPPTTEVRTMTPETNPAGGGNPSTVTPPPVPSANAQRFVEEQELIDFGTMHNEVEMAREFALTGKSLKELRQAIIDKRAAAQKAVTVATPVTTLGMSEREVKSYSIVRAINAQLDNDWSKAGLEREAHQTLLKSLPQEIVVASRGFFVPYDIQLRALELTRAQAERLQMLMSRTLSTATSAAGGALVATNLLAASFIDLLRSKSVVINNGAQMLSGLVGNVAVPKQTGAATAYWVAQGAAPTASDAAFGQVPMSPKTLAALTEFTRQLMLQSTPDIEQLVINDIARVMALGIDKAALHGPGTGNQPTGITSTSGVGTATVGAAPANFDHTKSVEMESTVLEANVEAYGLRYITRPSHRGTLKSRPKVAGYPIFICEKDEINGYPCVHSTQVTANNVIFGDLSQVIIGEWGVLEIRVNPYGPNADAGNIRINAFESADVAIRYPEAFVVCNDFK